MLDFGWQTETTSEIDCQINVPFVTSKCDSIRWRLKIKLNLG